MVAASLRPRRARKQGSDSYYMTCETPAARWRSPLRKGASNEEATETPVLARGARRRRLRCMGLPAGALAGDGERPDRLRRRIGPLARLEHHRRTGVHRYSPQTHRDRTLKRFAGG